MGGATAASWALLGLGAYFLLYFQHERIWNDRPLPQAPALLTRLLRHRTGRLFVIAVATELWGATQFVIGALVYVGIAGPRTMVEVGLVSTGVVIGTGIAVDITRRRTSQ